MAPKCQNQRKIAIDFRHLHGYISLTIFRKAPPNSTPYSFRKKEVGFRKTRIYHPVSARCSYSPSCDQDGSFLLASPNVGANVESEKTKAPMAPKDLRRPVTCVPFVRQ